MFIKKILATPFQGNLPPKKILVYGEKGGIFNPKKYSFLLKKGVYFGPKILAKGVFVKSWNTR